MKRLDVVKLVVRRLAALWPYQHKIEQKVIDCCWGPSIKLKWWLKLRLPYHKIIQVIHTIPCVHFSLVFLFASLFFFLLFFNLSDELRDSNLISCSNNRYNVCVSLLALLLCHSLSHSLSLVRQFYVLFQKFYLNFRFKLSQSKFVFTFLKILSELLHIHFNLNP